MPESCPSRAILPHPVPEPGDLRLILVILRRMAAHGLQDSRAVMLAFDSFALGFRRPLTLLRAYLVEVARASRRQILFAPCCAGRMTLDEAQLTSVLVAAQADPNSAARQLSRLCANAAIAAPLQVASLIGEAMAEMGRPLQD